MLLACGSRRSTSSRSNFGRKIIEAPAASTTLVATNRPWVWKIGRACSSTSSSVNRQRSTRVNAFDSRFSCVIIAPLERPVVPEV